MPILVQVRTPRHEAEPHDIARDHCCADHARRQEITALPVLIAEPAHGQPAEHRQGQIMERGAAGINNDAETGRPGDDIVAPHGSRPCSLHQVPTTAVSARSRGRAKRSKTICPQYSWIVRAASTTPAPRSFGSSRPRIQLKRPAPSARTLMVRVVGRKRGRHRANAIRMSRICATCVGSLEARRRNMAYHAMI